MQTLNRQLDEDIHTTEEDLAWQALTQCQITLPLGRLLQQLPRFTKGLKMALTPLKPVVALTYLTNPSQELAVKDENNPVVTIIINGKEVPGTIIDGGSGVNVNIKKTRDKLGIREWEPCPFWLQMVDASSVRLMGLIRNMEITMGGYSFQISAVVLKLSAPGTYPLLLGRP